LLTVPAKVVFIHQKIMQLDICRLTFHDMYVYCNVELETTFFFSSTYIDWIFPDNCFEMFKHHMGFF